MQRVAPCVVNQDGPGVMLLVFDRLCDLELELVGELGEFCVGERQFFPGTSLYRPSREIGAMGELGASQHLGELFVADRLSTFSA